MPVVYRYLCDACDHAWSLFSTRLALGPTQWGHVEYTCFSCQTFLNVARKVDRNAWSIWLHNNSESLNNISALTQMAKSIEEQFAVANGLTPIELDFDMIDCPTCGNDQLRDIPFGEHLMRCTQCNQYTGKLVDDYCITISTVVDPIDEIDK